MKRTPYRESLRAFDKSARHQNVNSSPVLLFSHLILIERPFRKIASLRTITVAHFLLYSRFSAVDSNDGWLIFALPPAEIGVHPSDKNFVQRHAARDLLGAVLYLMPDDNLRRSPSRLTARYASPKRNSTARYDKPIRAIWIGRGLRQPSLTSH
jgi:hypothetical protein